MNSQAASHVLPRGTPSNPAAGEPAARADSADRLRLYNGQIDRYRPGQVVYREGEVAARVYVVCSGMAKLIRHLPNGRARIVSLHKAGSMLGPPDMAARLVNPHTAVALGQLELESLPRDQFRRLCESQPEHCRQVFELVAAQARQADLWITEFSTGSIDSRVARLIRFLSRLEDGVPGGEVELLTCQDMGEILGVTPESVSRAVARMKRRKLLRPVARRPTGRFAFDLEALEHVAAR